MKEFTATASIRAAPETIWSILTDGPGYVRWNPEINLVEGRIDDLIGWQGKMSHLPI